VVGGGQAGHQVVEVAGALGVDPHQRGLHRLEPHGRGEDHPGQAHPAGGGVEQIGAARDDPDPAVGRQQLQGDHVPRERARDVVVLAVDVGADRPADGDVARAGGDRHEPAERQQQAHQRVQGDARVAEHGAALDVDGVDAVQARHVEHGPARVLRGVAVRPAQAPGDAAAGPAVPDGGDRLRVAARADQTGGGGGGAAPSGDGNGVGRHGGDRIVTMCLIRSETSASSPEWVINGMSLNNAGVLPDFRCSGREQ
jgi:hypothetical protein